MLSLCVRNRQGGFTLIELMVAISIVSIMSVAGLTFYGAAQRSARDSKRVQDVLEIQKALEQYYAINHGNPSPPPYDYPLVPAARPDWTAISTTDFTGGNDLNSYFQGNKPPVTPNRIDSTYDYQYLYCAGPPMKYVVCAKLENDRGGNLDALGNVDATNCRLNSDTANPQKYYCVTSLSQ